MFILIAHKAHYWQHYCRLHTRSRLLVSVYYYYCYFLTLLFHPAKLATCCSCSYYPLLFVTLSVALISHFAYLSIYLSVCVSATIGLEQLYSLNMLAPFNKQHKAIYLKLKTYHLKHRPQVGRLLHLSGGHPNIRPPRI